MTTTYHRLAPAQFDELAGGGGGASAIHELHAAQISKHLLLIQHLLAQWPADDAERGSVATLLERVRETAPERFRDLVGDPMVGAWTAIAARAVENDGAARADFLHLGALAVVGCVAAGIDGAAATPVHGGLAFLPGLGAAEVGEAETARAVVSSGRLVVHGLGPGGETVVEVPADPTTDAPGWQPVRRLVGDAAGRRIQLRLDDLDPYRHGHHVPPALRLSADDVDRWQELFQQSWTLLAERLPGRADELIAGLRTFVPLLQTDARTARSATIRHAFGVFGLTLPPSPAEFAVTMVHEFQHSKLSAMLDLVRLTDPDHTGLYFAPWRVDPRPLAGLLQGVYAFVGVADTWRALRDVDGIGPGAAARFAEARLQVDRGLTAVEESTGLTDDGVAFVARLRQVTDEMLAEPVEPAVARAAEAALERTRQSWEDRNAKAGEEAG